MAIGLDFGTMNLVASRKGDDGKTKVSAERNCFYDLDPEWESSLDDTYNFIRQVENGKQRLFVVGKDAMNLANLVAKKDGAQSKTALRRPMQKMVINSKTDKMAIQMLKYMSQGLVGPPKEENEICVISVPANPISGSFNNIFHSQMCQSFIKELGYEVFPIDEFLAVIYASNPTMEEDGNEIPMTGVGISWGAGGTNCGVAYKGQPTVNFALDKGGDWIDEQVSTVTSLTSSEACIAKEKLSKDDKLNLESPDLSDEVSGAVYIYYDNLIRTVVKEFKKQFIEKQINFNNPVQVVISGGTSKMPGFEKLFEKIVQEESWPFSVSQVVRAKDPLAATAVGAMNAAISKEKKRD